MRPSPTCDSLVLVLALVLVLGTGARAAPSTFTLEVNGEITDVEVADLDGDGARDVLLHGARKVAGAHERFLAAFHRRDGKLPPRPDVDVKVPPDVLVAGAGDVLPGPAAEVLLFTPRAIWRLDLAAKSEAARYRKLCESPSFFFYADPERLPVWDLLGDLDGDGLPEVLAPEAERGLAVLRPTAGGDRLEQVERLLLEAGGSSRASRSEPAGGDGGSLSFALGGRVARVRVSAEVAGTLYRRSRTVSRPYLLDVDGDGPPELVTVMDAYRLSRAGKRARARERDFAFTSPRAGTGSVLADVDGDGLPDRVAREIKLADQASTIEVSAGTLTASVFSLCERQQLKLDGIVAGLEVVDLDGDGRRDLVAVSYRLDLLRGAAAGAAPESLDVTWSVFRGGEAPGPFGRKRAFGGTIPLKLGGEATSLAPISFAADFDGDGRADALVRESSGRVRVHRLARATGLFEGGEIGLADPPLLDIPAAGAAGVEALDLGGKGRALAIRFRSRLEVHLP